MQYEVHTVSEDDLPPGVHSVIVERVDAPALLVINGPVAECWRFMRAWEDTHEPCDLPSVTLPIALPFQLLAV